jgi:O-antigen ligase
MKYGIFCFFFLLSVGLWLGDGQNAIINIILPFALLISCFIIERYGTSQRSLPRLHLFLGVSFITYAFIRSIYSDDIGYSIYIVIRYLSCGIIYCIWYCYSTPDMLKPFVTGIIGFSLFALISTTILILFPHLYTFNQMNLLTAQYAHNAAIIPILFSFAAVVYLWLETKKPYLLVLSIIFFIGSLLSFARAAIFSELVILLGIGISRYIKYHKVEKTELVVGLVALIAGIGIFCIPYRSIPEDISLFNPTIKTQNPLPDRMSYWRQAATAIRERPLVGFGPGTFFIQSLRLQQGPLDYVVFPHNLLLDLLVDVGAIGAIPLMGLLYLLICAWKKGIGKQSKQTKLYWGALLISLSSIILYGMGDFPLNFFVPLVLFWTILGTMTGTLATKEKKGNTMWIIHIGQAILSILVLIALYDQLATNVWKTIPCERIRALPLGRCLMRNINKTIPITKQDLVIYELLHKTNSPVLYAIGYKQKSIGNADEAERVLYHAVLTNPYNQYVYSDYLDLIAQTHPEQLGKQLELLSCKAFSPALCNRIHAFGLTSEIYKPALVSIFVRTNDMTMYQDYAVMLYRLGKYFLPTEPKITEELWTFIRDAHPMSGPFHSELASLYEYTFKDANNAREVLQSCLQYKPPAKECTLRLTDGLQEPGSLEKAIMANWDY